MTTCWSCGADQRSSLTCTECGKIQPVGTKSFFDLLGLTPRLSQSRGDIDRAFREASKLVHPDRLDGAASALERRLSVEMTAQLNEAYRTLRDAQSRAEYLLSLQGVEVGGEMARTKDPALLMDMMEQQEAVDAADTDEALEAQRNQMIARRTALMDGLERYFDHGEGERDKAAQTLDELRYLRRLIERIDTKLEEMM